MYCHFFGPQTFFRLHLQFLYEILVQVITVIVIGTFSSGRWDYSSQHRYHPYLLYLLYHHCYSKSVSSNFTLIHMSPTGPPRSHSSVAVVTDDDFVDPAGHCPHSSDPLLVPLPQYFSSQTISIQSPFD